MMKKLIVAMGLLLVGMPLANAQDWRRDRDPAYRPAPTPPPVPGYRPAPPPPPVVNRPVFVPVPSIPVWRPGAFPYEARYHDTCQRKAWRLRWFERRAAADGVMTWSERNELRELRRDLRRTCGDWRWRD